MNISGVILFPGAPEPAGAAGGIGEIVRQFVEDGFPVHGHQLKQPLTGLDYVGFVADIITVSGEFTPVAGVDQADGIAHPERRFGNAGSRNQPVRDLFGRFTGNPQVDGFGLPGRERNPLRTEQIQPGIPGVKVPVILVIGKNFS